MKVKISNIIIFLCHTRLNLQVIKLFPRDRYKVDKLKY
jgi:hypothetical protein